MAAKIPVMSTPREYAPTGNVVRVAAVIARGQVV